MYPIINTRANIDKSNAIKGKRECVQANGKVPYRTIGGEVE